MAYRRKTFTHAEKIKLHQCRVREIYPGACLQGVPGEPYRFQVVKFGLRKVPQPISAAFADPDDAWLDVKL